MDETAMGSLGERDIILFLPILPQNGRFKLRQYPVFAGALGLIHKQAFRGRILSFSMRKKYCFAGAFAISLLSPGNRRSHFFGCAISQIGIDQGLVWYVYLGSQAFEIVYRSLIQANRDRSFGRFGIWILDTF
jgi:hypothetical protein